LNGIEYIHRIICKQQRCSEKFKQHAGMQSMRGKIKCTLTYAKIKIFLSCRIRIRKLKQKLIYYVAFTYGILIKAWRIPMDSREENNTTATCETKVELWMEDCNGKWGDINGYGVGRMYKE
jgi:hypothetical protein